MTRIDQILTIMNQLKKKKDVGYFLYGRALLAQLVRSLPSDHKVPSSIAGFAEV